MAKKLKVLIVDDSALIRNLLSEILGADPDIEVVGSALDPYIARNKIKDLNPDVLTLDIEMPRMDGLSFLENLMRLHPMPVVMIASVTDDAANKALEAVRLGAVDFIQKPQLTDINDLYLYSDEITQKVKAAGKVNILRQESFRKFKAPKKAASHNSRRIKALSKRGKQKPGKTLIVIGASTGGTEAISKVINDLPADMPPIAIVQHIPPVFSRSFANRLNENSALEVFEAEEGMRIQPGRVVIAPGDFHLMIRKDAKGWYCHLNQDYKVNQHRPSVDVLYRSCLELKANKLALLLTGMGSDGALGMEQLRLGGATTIAQDEKSSVIWGMPGSAVKKGAAEYITPLKDISPLVQELVKVD